MGTPKESKSRETTSSAESIVATDFGNGTENTAEIREVI